MFKNFRMAPANETPIVELNMLENLRSELIESGCAALWKLDTSFLQPQQGAFEACLSADERERLENIASAEGRTRFTLFRGALRHILANQYGVTPDEIHFEYSATGKPSLAASGSGARLSFSLSHTRDLAVIACAWAAPIGVDLEWKKRKSDIHALTARFFHPNERLALAGLPPEQQRELFFKWWTGKESSIKAWGSALVDALGQLDFSGWQDDRALALYHADKNIAIGWAFEKSEALAGTLVIPPDTRKITCYTVPDWPGNCG